MRPYALATIVKIVIVILPTLLQPLHATAQSKVIRVTAEEKYKGDLALDYYKATKGVNAPLVIFIHGGGWKQGDKRGFRRAAAVFNDVGFAAASINYSLSPASSVEAATSDVAAAVSYLKANAGRLGFDGSRISLIGHSAGAYYAALVSTNEQYLPKGTIKSVALLDCRACDVPAEMKRKRAEALTEIFGSDQRKWKILSPSTYLDGNDPKFWLAYVSSNRNSEIDATSFAALVKGAGGNSEAEGFADVTHADFVKNLGDTNFEPTTKLVKYLIKNAQ